MSASLLLTHAKYQFIEQIRVPISLVASAFFPAAAMLAFVLPNIGDDPTAATVSTASMLVFTMISATIMGLGITIADDRAQPWDPYTRTLSAGPMVRFSARLVTNMLIMLLAFVPVLLIAAFLTNATVTPLELAAGIGALLLGSVPFALIGLTIGYLLPLKAAIPVTQLTFFPMAVLGGLLTNPMDLPSFIEVVSPYVPTRGAVELVWAATIGFPVNSVAMIMFAVWIVLGGAAAVWAYKRDEGNRYS